MFYFLSMKLNKQPYISQLNIFIEINLGVVLRKETQS